LLSTTTGGEQGDAPIIPFARAVQVHQNLKVQKVDVVGTDDIGKSSADDMFAFS